MNAKHASFFDVDETLITGKSMFDFLDYYCASTPTRLSSDHVRADITRAVADGVTRDQVNRLFYSHLAGERWADLIRSGKEWYTTESTNAGFFRREVAEQLARDRERGNTIVLVSGSFLPALQPIAVALSADAVLCTELEIRDGITTGRTSAPMIGEQKRRSVVEYARQHGVHLGASHAYGDHESDFPMLTTVGHPVVVNADKRMRELAERQRFALLEVVTTPTNVQAQAIPATVDLDVTEERRIR